MFKRLLRLFCWIAGVFVIMLILLALLIPVRYGEEEYTIAGLRSQVTTNHDVLRLYGKPASISEGMIGTEWHYPGLILEYLGPCGFEVRQNAFFVTVTDSKYTTHRGIHVGSTAEEVRKAYPEAYEAGGDSISVRFWDLYVTMVRTFGGYIYDYRLEFFIRDGNVAAMRFSAESD